MNQQIKSGEVPRNVLYEATHLPMESYALFRANGFIVTPIQYALQLQHASTSSVVFNWYYRTGTLIQQTKNVITKVGSFYNPKEVLSAIKKVLK